MSDSITEMIRDIERLRRDVERLKTRAAPTWVYLASPLNSGDWNGNAYSTASKTLIDLSAVFAVPDGIRAILCSVYVRDSASAGINVLGIYLAPNSIASSGVFVGCGGFPNDYWNYNQCVIPCDANGDIYYQTIASGASTLDIYIKIWGYMI